MDLTKAASIQGWMSAEELTWLGEQAEQHINIVEIGSFMGRSTRMLTDNTKGQVTAVDVWNLDIPEYSRLLQGRPISALFEKFKLNMLGVRNLRIAKKSSLEAATEFRDEKFDMVFIDADHSYEGVTADIAAWKPLVSAGGIICGHDWDWESVRKAVTDSLPQAIPVAGSIWALTCA